MTNNSPSVDGIQSGLQRQDGASPQQTLSVSDVTHKIKSLLEDNIPYIWIYGEISNFSRSAAGHCYLTLKDAEAQISAVIFKGQYRRLTFSPENGASVTALARLTVYPPRGAYQLIVEHMLPSGAGALQAAVEALKKRLAAEGLFADDRKCPLPLLPGCIALITSPTGAVVHDFQQVARRRFPGIAIHVEGVKVQGAGAEAEIVAALERIDRSKMADVIVLARGGGSIEDLQAFNTEVLARAIAAVETPVVSAVGHETDFTIADFVADLRAPTPSAAAELTVPDKLALATAVADRQQRLIDRFQRTLADRRLQLASLTGRLATPAGRLSDARLRLDDASRRIIHAAAAAVERRQAGAALQRAKLARLAPLAAVARRREQLQVDCDRLKAAVRAAAERRTMVIDGLTRRLDALNPYAVLQRGYSIVRTLPEGRILKSSREAKTGKPVDITLAEGRITATVTETT